MACLALPEVSDTGLGLLSELTVFDKYAKYLQYYQRRENWDEIVERNKAMQVHKYPNLKQEINAIYENFVRPKLALPSMRSLQFAGKPIEINPTRVMNCAALPIDDVRAFREIMFLLMGGTGVGYSVQHAHINKLPRITHPTSSRRYLIQDSLMGWADAVDALIKAYLCGAPRPIFDGRDIRERGALLKTTGGRAPGPEGLLTALANMERVLERFPHGARLTSLPIHDIICFSASAVLSGGIRRSAMISLFDFDDMEMIEAKSGEWWVDNPQRALANNSAMALRHKITRSHFDNYMERVEESGSGEPGIFFVNDSNALTNPCFRGDTLVTTDQGLRRIDRLVGASTRVWDGTQWVKVDNFRVTGENQPTLEIELHDGSSVVVTPYHTMILADGTRLEARHLSLGDHLAIGNHETVGGCAAASAYLKGFLVGDPTSEKYALYLYPEEPKFVCADRLATSAKQTLPNLSGMRSDTETEVSWRSDTTFMAMQGLSARHFTSWATEAKVEFPAEVFEWDRDSRAEFVAGVMDADGTAFDSANGFSYQVTSIHRDWLVGFQALLKTMGVQSTIGAPHPGGFQEFANERWALSIPQASSIKLAREVSFTRLTSFADRECKYNVKPEWNRVAAIRKAGVEKRVYCCTVPSTNSLTIGVGIQVGQCAETQVDRNFCNLTTMNLSAVESQGDLEAFASAAAFLGTLQAGYTDYHYLRPVWRERTEKEALLGVSMTGIARDDLHRFDFPRAVARVAQVNESLADWIGINPAYRLTANKPEGTSSAVLQTSSGLHAWHDKFFIRRTRYTHDSALIQYLRDTFPKLVEDDRRDPNLAVVSLPCRAPDNAVTREEPMLDMLERIRKMSTEWVRPGHRKGHNGHSVSATVSVKDNEWGDLKDWMWDHRHDYNGITVLPYDGGTYEQAPFESITEDQYRMMAQGLPKTLNLDQVREEVDGTLRQQEIACASGACEI